MRGHVITIWWKEQDLNEQSEFLSEQQYFGDRESCIPASEQDNSFFVVPISLSECAGCDYNLK